MNYKFPIGCTIPFNRRRHGISWLEIHQADRGYYLLQFEDPQAASNKWDSFYPSIDDAMSDCKETWGIDRKDWKEVEPPDNRSMYQRTR